MIEQAVNYFEQIEALAKQQVPIDWKAVATQMVVILKQAPVAPAPTADIP